MSLTALRQLTVDAFPSSSARPRLFSELKRLVHDLEVVSICCELWVNGSFLTQTDTPADIDLSCHMHVSDLERIEPGMRNVILETLKAGRSIALHLNLYLHSI